jgi:type II secretory ATPase GspE/PulE/Tfp pilus assembly ATPase PilB-like protein
MSDRLADTLGASWREQIGELGKEDLSAGRLLRSRIGDADCQMIGTRIRTATGEHLCIQLEDATEDATLSALGYTDKQTETVRTVLDGRPGLAIAAGSAGPFSDLHSLAMARLLAEGGRLVVSLERTLHFLADELVQLSAPRDPDRLHDVLDRALAMAPDALLFDEVDNEEVCRAMMEAAGAGMTVVAKVREATGVGALARLRDLGCSGRFLAEHMLGMLVRRPSRRMCSSCRRTRTPTPEERELLACGPDATVAEPVGCNECGDGYVGRRMLHVVLPASAELSQHLMAADEDPDQLRAWALRQPMSFVHSAREAALSHEVAVGDIEALLRTCAALDSPSPAP